MPIKFRKDYRVNKVTAHIRKKENGSYEIRCQYNKRQISACGKTLEIAKERFLDKLNNLENSNAPVKIKKLITLGEYVMKWVETVKKPYIKEKTYNDYIRMINAYILPKYGNTPIAYISQLDVQEYINSLAEQNKNRTAKKLLILLSAVFDYAVNDNIINKSPTAKVVAPHHEEEHGTALTRDEERQLIELLKKGGSIHIQAFVFLIYTGLRRSELASIEVSDGWIYLTSAKGRKGYKEKQRSLPICPMLAQVMEYIDIETIKNISPDKMTRNFKKIFPNHHLHETRHTFITRCQECGIRREIVSLWVGHAADSSITSAVYTHLEQNKELQENEMKKFAYNMV